MKYVCIDRGSQYCPCHLMEVGQCYTCTMIREGRCSCDQAAGWQGVCPYTEFLQYGSKPSPKASMIQAPIIERKIYSADLVVVKVNVSRGYAQKCRKPGTFVMAEALGYKIPLSVLKTERDAEAGWLLHFAIKPAGPKTLQLLREDCESWKLTGPFYNGLINSEVLDLQNPSLIIAKGTALAPFICGMKDMTHNMTELYLDMDKLSDDFAKTYLDGQPYTTVSLTIEEEVQTLKRLIKEKMEEKKDCNLLLLVSPYYAAKLTEGLDTVERIVQPNPANMCCGEGICGACSHTDANGMTVRLCKCNQSMIESME